MTAELTHFIDGKRVAGAVRTASRTSSTPRPERFRRKVALGSQMLPEMDRRPSPAPMAAQPAWAADEPAEAVPVS